MHEFHDPVSMHRLVSSVNESPVLQVHGVIFNFTVRFDGRTFVLHCCGGVPYHRKQADVCNLVVEFCNGGHHSSILSEGYGPIHNAGLFSLYISHHVMAIIHKITGMDQLDTSSESLIVRSSLL